MRADSGRVYPSIIEANLKMAKYVGMAVQGDSQLGSMAMMRRWYLQATCGRR